MERLTVHVDPISSSENRPLFGDVKVRGETGAWHIWHLGHGAKTY